MPNSISADFAALKAKTKIIDDLLGGTQKCDKRVKPTSIK